MTPDELVLVVAVRCGPVFVPRLRLGRRPRRVCVPWHRAVGAGLRLMLGLDAG
jgi:hypothetical protein